jgi:nitrogen fixation protein NifU and related proteins
MKQENIDPSYAGDGIYKENILDHYKNPHNKGNLEKADVTFTENNPVCGDVITIYLKISDGKVADSRFNGTGCAISQAAASMLTDHIKGMDMDKVKNLKREDVVQLLGIDIGIVRTKCATLSLVAIRKAIETGGY